MTDSPGSSVSGGTLFAITSALVCICFLGAVLGLWQWGQQVWWARFDIYSVGALSLSALLVMQHIRFFRRLPCPRQTAAEAFGATYDPLMGVWNSLLLIAELAAVVDYGQWRLTPWIEQPGLQTAGLAIFALALGLVIWADQHLLRHFAAPRAERKLITEGPYRYLPHPRYLGLFLTRVGFALVFASVIAWALLPVWAMVVCRRIRIEEQHLTRTYG